MASYDQLPIYKVSYDVFIALSSTVKSFPKEYKYTIGARLQDTALELLTEVTLAALGDSDKLEHIKKAKKNLEVLKILRRACNSINILSHNQYTTLLFPFSAISKQLVGWEKSQTQ